MKRLRTWILAWLRREDVEDEEWFDEEDLQMIPPGDYIVVGGMIWSREITHHMMLPSSVRRGTWN